MHTDIGHALFAALRQRTQKNVFWTFIFFALSAQKK
jgi:hypothetical protein